MRRGTARRCRVRRGLLVPGDANKEGNFMSRPTTVAPPVTQLRERPSMAFGNSVERHGFKSNPHDDRHINGHKFDDDLLVGRDFDDVIIGRGGAGNDLPTRLRQIFRDIRRGS